MIGSGLAAALEPVSRFGGIAIFLIQAGLIAVLFRAMAVFRTEVRKVDTLVSEYVRCRDYLLASRRPGEESDWRNTDAGAFREAWANFNHQLETIRKRYARAVRHTGWLLGLLLVFLVAAIIVWMIGLPSAEGPLRLMTPLGVAATGLFLWGAAWTSLRAQHQLMRTRTDGNYLIAPWPIDGGSADRHLALLDKFLPVEVIRPEGDAATEVV